MTVIGRETRILLDKPDIEDFILAVFYYAGGKVPTKIHLMKTLAAYAILTGRENFFEYAPYRKGLYSAEVDAAFTELANTGYIQWDHGYRLTRKGLAYSREAVQRIEAWSRDDAELLKKLVELHLRLKKDEVLLLHYVIFCKEACREVSEEWKRIKHRRAEIALEMLRRGRVSWRLAARLAGMSHDEFLEYARRHGIEAGDRVYLEDIDAGERDAEALRARLKRRNNS